MRDLLQVLVRGGVADQFTQTVGDAAGAQGAGGLQGLVSEGNGLQGVAGGAGE